MGQSVSGERFFSLFSRSSNPKPSCDGCRECDRCRCESRNFHRSKNFNSFSCFKSQNTGDANRTGRAPAKVVPKRRNSLPDIRSCREIENADDAMPKKCYNFCNDEETDDPSDDRQNCNYGRVKRCDGARRSCENLDEIESDPNEPTQSCSRNNTSINRYISAFNQSIEKLSIEDDSCKSAGRSKKSSKSRDLKRKSKSNDVKETKNKPKKKNTWGMRIYGSKLTKVNNGKVSLGDASSSSLDSESGCVCTSYKQVEYDDNQADAEPVTAVAVVEAPRQQQQLSLGWASERVNMNRGGPSNWNMTSRSSGIYSQQNRTGECISCEGSHCHVDVEFSNLSGLPINIAVARVGPNHNSISGSGTSENNVIFLSLGTQNNQVFDLSRINSEDHMLEDCEERARVLRALEIAEGVEPPPGYNSPHIQVVSPSELRALLFQQQPSTYSHQIHHHHGRIHTQVDYIHCLVPDLRSITSCSFYWGKMDRYEAERLLEGKDEGTFLLRDSAQEEYLFSVSFRKYQRSLHARIEQFNHKFSFDSHDPGVFASDTVTGLIEHYKDPSCVMFFEPMLTAPLSRTFTFPLQHLCRAVIVSCTNYDGINKLRLPNSIKTYLKEYHYRQRVRIKRFDESPDIAEEAQ